MLGSTLLPTLLPHFAPSHDELDVRKPVIHSEFYRSMSAKDISQIQTVIHCAALLNRACERNKREAMQTNVIGTANIVEFCHDINARCVFISTEYIFRGDRGEYSPGDEVGPVNYYGETKLAGEYIVKSLPSYLIIRVAFLPEPFPYEEAYTDLISSKLRLSIAAERIVDLVKGGETGIHHVCGPVRSIYDYTKEHCRGRQIRPAVCNDGIARPINASMVTGKG